MDIVACPDSDKGCRGFEIGCKGQLVQGFVSLDERDVHVLGPCHLRIVSRKGRAVPRTMSRQDFEEAKALWGLDATTFLAYGRPEMGRASCRERGCRKV